MRNGQANTLGTHRLRRLLACLSALTIGCGQLTAHGQDTGRKTGLQLNLQLPREQYEAGSSVTLRIEFQNQGSQQIKVGFALQGETGEKLSMRLEKLCRIAPVRSNSTTNSKSTRLCAMWKPSSRPKIPARNPETPHD